MKDDLNIIQDEANTEKSKSKNQDKNRRINDRRKRDNINLFEPEDSLDDIWFSLWNGI